MCVGVILCYVFGELDSRLCLYLTLDYIWVCVQQVFNFFRSDVFPAPHDDVLQPAHDSAVAIFAYCKFVSENGK